MRATGDIDTFSWPCENVRDVAEVVSLDGEGMGVDRRDDEANTFSTQIATRPTVNNMISGHTIMRSTQI
jgi:hypothetical protein